MTPKQMEERIKRLEFCFQTFVAAASGQLHTFCTPEQLELSRAAFEQEMNAMQRDIDG